MKKRLVFAGLAVCAAAVPAEVIVDFTRDADKVHLVGGAYTNASDRARQVEATPKGLRMTFDSDRMKADRWNTVAIDASLGAAHDWTGREVDLVMRERSLVGVTRGMAFDADKRHLTVAARPREMPVQGNQPKRRVRHAVPLDRPRLAAERIVDPEADDHLVRHQILLDAARLVLEGFAVPVREVEHHAARDADERPLAHHQIDLASRPVVRRTE